jgi:NAD-dependent SIR2 family protein deacetylase
MLQNWADEYGLDSFVVTSNVDGQFQKAGYRQDQILEVHGSIHHLQCLSPCSTNIWDNQEEIPVNFDSMRAEHVPVCPDCNGTARPNILMFGDFSWISSRTQGQEMRFDMFVEQHRNEPFVVVEMGAGTAIPTIRHMSEQLGYRLDTTVIRINPREPYIDDPHLSIECGALEGLQKIDSYLQA